MFSSMQCVCAETVNMMNTRYTQYSDRNKELQNVVSVRVERTEMLTTNLFLTPYLKLEVLLDTFGNRAGMHI